MLYPRESETRLVKDLSGLWSFKQDIDNIGITEHWEKVPLTGTQWMPVPASYNDITQDVRLRDHVGLVWYETEVWVPNEWKEKQVRVRVGSAAHEAMLFVNGQKLVEHVGGFLPFECDASSLIKYGESNRLTIVVDNRLTYKSLPLGNLKINQDETHPTGHTVQETYFDYYNYAGIHRPVKLVALPRAPIEDITVHTDIDGTTGFVHYAIAQVDSTYRVHVCLLDENGERVAEAQGAEGKLRVPEARFWDPESPYLYKLEVKTFASGGDLHDCYRLPIGIRTIRVTETQFLLNGKPVYFKGFGRHEDMDIKGKGLDHAMLLKDFNLMRWIGANSFRTSHYPYAEETMQLADQYGFLVIDEIPACGFNFWDRGREVFSESTAGSKTQANHLREMRELIERDKNHPSVVMWSIGNEPSSYEEGAGSYFKPVFDLCRELDPSRPVTCVECSLPMETTVAQYCDVLCVNRYYAWYSDAGRLDLIGEQLRTDLTQWHTRFNKPVLLSEFGADTVAGMHADPPVMFTEEYQVEFLKTYFGEMDHMDFLIGEHVWNFADFATRQGITRVGGNKKGIFTRQRQPKAAAFILRERWQSAKH